VIGSWYPRFGKRFKDTALSAMAIMCTMTTRHLSARQWRGQAKQVGPRRRRRRHSYHLQSGEQNKGNYGIIRARCSNCIGRKHLSHIGSSQSARVDKSTAALLISPAAQRRASAICTSILIRVDLRGIKQQLSKISFNIYIYLTTTPELF